MSSTYGDQQQLSPPASPRSSDDYTYKIILIGSAAVGKTNLISVGARGLNFNDKCPPTLNPEFATVKIMRPDWKLGEPNRYLTAHIWDTAGQERYQAISSSHYRRAHGALLCFDVSNKLSLKEIYPGVKGGNEWLRRLKENTDPNLLSACMLMETKIDKVDDAESSRPPEYVHETDVRQIIDETVFRDPEKGIGWLHHGDRDEVVPYRIANNFMYARSSSATKKCELYELTERRRTLGKGMIPGGIGIHHDTKLEYVQNQKVQTIEKAIEALILRIYERSKCVQAGGTKLEGHPFRIQLPKPKEEPKSPDACC